MDTLKIAYNTEEGCITVLTLLIVQVTFLIPLFFCVSSTLRGRDFTPTCVYIYIYFFKKYPSPPPLFYELAKNLVDYRIACGEKKKRQRIGKDTDFPDFQKITFHATMIFLKGIESLNSLRINYSNIK